MNGQQGTTRKWVILTITFIATTVVVGGVLIWALINYFDQKNNVDTKVASAVSTAEKTLADKDAANFEAAEKKPTREFVGPEDYGELRFSYPKTWSTYISKDGSVGSTFQAYLNPVSVPAVSTTQQYALRVTIETKDYDQVINGYGALVKKGDLKSSVVKASGQNGTRLDGTFTKDIRGAAVIFKIRDKTVTVQTDADTFKPDFDTLVATLTFNQ